MPILKLFKNPSAAQSAAAALRDAGYEDVEVVNDARAADALVGRGVTAGQAERLAARIAQGETLVLVRAAFGTGAAATEILEEAGSAEDDGAAHPDEPGPDNAAPFSHALGLPLLSGGATPLSRLLGLPVLARRQTPGRSSLGLPTLAGRATPLSSAIGLPTVTRPATPFKGVFGIALLSARAAPLSRALGLRTLATEPAPLSKAAGIRTLSNNAAPLSRLLGLPVLSGDKTHMS